MSTQAGDGVSMAHQPNEARQFTEPPKSITFLDGSVSEPTGKLQTILKVGEK